jgi:hypothetical protein
MVKRWQLTETKLEKLLLVRRVVISPLIGQKLEEEDEASKSTKPRRVKTTTKNSQSHTVSGKK